MFTTIPTSPYTVHVCIFYKLCPSYIKILIPSKQTVIIMSINTRAARNIHINYHRLTRSLNSVSHQGFKLYNKLPKEIKVLDQRKFKNKVKHVLLSNLPFSVNEYLSLQL